VGVVIHHVEPRAFALCYFNFPPSAHCILVSRILIGDPRLDSRIHGPNTSHRILHASGSSSAIWMRPTPTRCSIRNTASFLDRALPTRPRPCYYFGGENSGHLIFADHRTDPGQEAPPRHPFYPCDLRSLIVANVNPLSLRTSILCHRERRSFLVANVDPLLSRTSILPRRKL